MTSDRPSTGRDLTATARRAGDLVQESVLGDFVRDLGRVRAIDLAYTLSAQVFVALMPLVLVITGAFSPAGQDSVMASELIQRFGLAGAAQVAVRQLFTTPGAGSGVYWTGVVIALYSAFSLARRVGRAYAAIWEVGRLPVGQQWRGLVWVLLQVVLVLGVSTLRGFGHDHGTAVQVVALSLLLVVWGAAEYAAQLLMTAGQVARDRLLVAAGLVSLGRLGVTLWSAFYLPGLLSRQSEHYGPIGVVFSLFTWIFATMLVLLLATLLGAVLTRRPARSWLRPAPSPAG